MIKSSVPMKLLTLALSASVIVAGVRLGMPETEVTIQGGGALTPARMGTSFEDMSVGTLIAVPTKEVALTPEPHDRPVAEISQTTEPMQALVAQPDGAAQITATVPAVPMRTTASAVAIVPLSVPVQTAKPVTPVETITSQEPDSTAPPLSIRPKRKNLKMAAVVASARPKPDAPKVQRSKPKKSDTQQGNAKRKNTKGAASGTKQQAKAKTEGRSKSAASQAGNAAVSNYPGKVMRRINRVPRPRVSARGTATVAFSVSANGGLAQVGVARTSGSAALDQAALRVIRKAAPFPKPPQGARRSFSIRIKGR